MSLRGKFLPLLKTARCRSVTGLTAFSVFHSSPSSPLPHKISCRFFDIYQFANKEAIEKERARLGDELNRGYFADISELRKHGGKVRVYLEVTLQVHRPELLDLQTRLLFQPLLLKGSLH